MRQRFCTWFWARREHTANTHTHTHSSLSFASPFDGRIAAGASSSSLSNSFYVTILGQDGTVVFSNQGPNNVMMSSKAMYHFGTYLAYISARPTGCQTNAQIAGPLFESFSAKFWQIPDPVLPSIPTLFGTRTMCIIDRPFQTCAYAFPGSVGNTSSSGGNLAFVSLSFNKSAFPAQPSYFQSRGIMIVRVFTKRAFPFGGHFHEATFHSLQMWDVTLGNLAGGLLPLPPNEEEFVVQVSLSPAWNGLAALGSFDIMFGDDPVRQAPLYHLGECIHGTFTKLGHVGVYTFFITAPDTTVGFFVSAGLTTMYVYGPTNQVMFKTTGKYKFQFKQTGTYRLYVAPSPLKFGNWDGYYGESSYMSNDWTTLVGTTYEICTKFVNAIVQPIKAMPGGIGTCVIDNPYGRCAFSFEIDGVNDVLASGLSVVLSELTSNSIPGLQTFPSAHTFSLYSDSNDYPFGPIFRTWDQFIGGAAFGGGVVLPAKDLMPSFVLEISFRDKATAGSFTLFFGNETKQTSIFSRLDFVNDALQVDCTFDAQVPRIQAFTFQVDWPGDTFTFLAQRSNNVHLQVFNSFGELLGSSLTSIEQRVTIKFATRGPHRVVVSPESFQTCNLWWLAGDSCFNSLWGLGKGQSCAFQVWNVSAAAVSSNADLLPELQFGENATCVFDIPKRKCAFVVKRDNRTVQEMIGSFSLMLGRLELLSNVPSFFLRTPPLTYVAIQWAVYPRHFPSAFNYPFKQGFGYVYSSTAYTAIKEVLMLDLSRDDFVLEFTLQATNQFAKFQVYLGNEPIQVPIDLDLHAVALISSQFDHVSHAKTFVFTAHAGSKILMIAPGFDVDVVPWNNEGTVRRGNTHSLITRTGRYRAFVYPPPPSYVDDFANVGRAFTLDWSGSELLQGANRSMIDSGLSLQECGIPVTCTILSLQSHCVVNLPLLKLDSRLLIVAHVPTVNAFRTRIKIFTTRAYLDGAWSSDSPPVYDFTVGTAGYSGSSLGEWVVKSNDTYVAVVYDNANNPSLGSVAVSVLCERRHYLNAEAFEVKISNGMMDSTHVEVYEISVKANMYYILSARNARGFVWLGDYGYFSFFALSSFYPVEFRVNRDGVLVFLFTLDKSEQAISSSDSGVWSLPSPTMEPLTFTLTNENGLALETDAGMVKHGQNKTCEFFMPGMSCTYQHVVVEDSPWPVFFTLLPPVRSPDMSNLYTSGVFEIRVFRVEDFSEGARAWSQRGDKSLKLIKSLPSTSPTYAVIEYFQPLVNGTYVLNVRGTPYNFFMNTSFILSAPFAELPEEVVPNKAHAVSINWVGETKRFTFTLNESRFVTLRCRLVGVRLLLFSGDGRTPLAENADSRRTYLLAGSYRVVLTPHLGYWEPFPGIRGTYSTEIIIHSAPIFTPAIQVEESGKAYKCDVFALGVRCAFKVQANQKNRPIFFSVFAPVLGDAGFFSRGCCSGACDCGYASFSVLVYHEKDYNARVAMGPLRDSLSLTERYLSNAAGSRLAGLQYFVPPANGSYVFMIAPDQYDADERTGIAPIIFLPVSTRSPREILINQVISDVLDSSFGDSREYTFDLPKNTLRNRIYVMLLDGIASYSKILMFSEDSGEFIPMVDNIAIDSFGGRRRMIVSRLLNYFDELPAPMAISFIIFVSPLYPATVPVHGLPTNPACDISKRGESCAFSVWHDGKSGELRRFLQFPSQVKTLFASFQRNSNYAIEASLFALEDFEPRGALVGSSEAILDFIEPSRALLMSVILPFDGPYALVVQSKYHDYLLKTTFSFLDKFGPEMFAGHHAAGAVLGVEFTPLVLQRSFFMYADPYVKLTVGSSNTPSTLVSPSGIILYSSRDTQQTVFLAENGTYSVYVESLTGQYDIIVNCINGWVDYNKTCKLDYGQLCNADWNRCTGPTPVCLPLLPAPTIPSRCCRTGIDYPCLSCNEEGYCNACRRGFTLKSVARGKDTFCCRNEVAYTGCANCTWGTGKCDSCSAGYTLQLPWSTADVADSSERCCNAITGFPTLCTSCKLSGGCNTCNAGLVLREFSTSPCCPATLPFAPDAPCTSCGLGGQCDRCAPGFNLVDSQCCKFKVKSPPCMSCDALTGECASCASGYNLDQDGTCKLPDGFSPCSSSTDCSFGVCSRDCCGGNYFAPQQLNTAVTACSLLLSNGQSCQTNWECQNGFCIAGICNNPVSSSSILALTSFGLAGEVPSVWSIKFHMEGRRFWTSLSGRSVMLSTGTGMLIFVHDESVQTKGDFSTCGSETQVNFGVMLPGTRALHEGEAHGVLSGVIKRGRLSFSPTNDLVLNVQSAIDESDKNVAKERSLADVRESYKRTAEAEIAATKNEQAKAAKQTLLEEVLKRWGLIPTDSPTAIAVTPQPTNNAPPVTVSADVEKSWGEVDSASTLVIVTNENLSEAAKAEAAATKTRSDSSSIANAQSSGALPFGTMFGLTATLPLSEQKIFSYGVSLDESWDPYNYGRIQDKFAIGGKKGVLGLGNFGQSGTCTVLPFWQQVNLAGNINSNSFAISYNANTKWGEVFFGSLILQQASQYDHVGVAKLHIDSTTGEYSVNVRVGNGNDDFQLFRLDPAAEYFLMGFSADQYIRTSLMDTYIERGIACSDVYNFILKSPNGDEFTLRMDERAVRYSGNDWNKTGYFYLLENSPVIGSPLWVHYFTIFDLDKEEVRFYTTKEKKPKTCDMRCMGTCYFHCEVKDACISYTCNGICNMHPYVDPGWCWASENAHVCDGTWECYQENDCVCDSFECAVMHAVEPPEITAAPTPPTPPPAPCCDKFCPSGCYRGCAKWSFGICTRYDYYTGTGRCWESEQIYGCEVPWECSPASVPGCACC